jgi:large subunit ribosomal protein L9
MATKQLILTENIPGLGAEADVVTVKAGYARNFLLPKGKAYEVTPSALRRIHILKAKRAEREARELAEAEELARKINKLNLQFTLETGQAGKAFGSVTNQDVAEKLKSELGGLEIDRHKISMEKQLKEQGEFVIPVKVHPDVIANLKITITAHEAGAEEAEDSPKESPAPKSKSTRKKK